MYPSRSSQRMPGSMPLSGDWQLIDSGINLEHLRGDDHLGVFENRSSVVSRSDRDLPRDLLAARVMEEVPETPAVALHRQTVVEILGQVVVSCHLRIGSATLDDHAAIRDEQMDAPVVVNPPIVVDLNLAQPLSNQLRVDPIEGDRVTARRQTAAPEVERIGVFQHPIEGRLVHVVRGTRTVIDRRRVAENLRQAPEKPQRRRLRQVSPRNRGGHLTDIEELLENDLTQIVVGHVSTRPQGVPDQFLHAIQVANGQSVLYPADLVLGVERHAGTAPRLRILSQLGFPDALLLAPIPRPERAELPPAIIVTRDTWGFGP